MGSGVFIFLSLPYTPDWINILLKNGPRWNIGLKAYPICSACDLILDPTCDPGGRNGGGGDLFPSFHLILHPLQYLSVNVAHTYVFNFVHFLLEYL